MTDRALSKDLAWDSGASRCAGDGRVRRMRAVEGQRFRLSVVEWENFWRLTFAKQTPCTSTSVLPSRMCSLDDHS